MMPYAPSRLIVAVLLAFVAIMLCAPDAFAIADDISTGTFSCSGGAATGNLFISGATCPTSLTMDNLFSFLVCNMEQLSSNVMGHMYCGMVQDLTPAVYAAVTFAILIFGITFTIGLTPATGQEALLFIIKIAFILAFATNADYLIGIAYRFLLAAMSDGTTIVLTVMNDDGVSSGADVYKQLDGFLATMMHYATDMVNQTVKSDICKNAVFAVLGTMFVVFPIIAYVGMLILARIVITFFRAVFAYIYAVVGITFLLLLAPFFLTFFLFKITRALFDRWLAYLASFTIQVVLLFSFLGFVFSMNLADSNVVKNLTSIIIFNEEAAEATAMRLPFKYCTLCDFKVVDKDNPGTEIDEKWVDPSDKTKTYITQGMLMCKDHASDSPVPKNLVPITNPDGSTVQALPIRPTFATAPNDKGKLSALLQFMGQGMLSLLVLAMIVEHLLKLIPSLAQKLASGLGAGYSTQLGGGGVMNPGDKDNPYKRTGLGGAPTVGLPGESRLDDFAAGFKSGFQGKSGDGKDGASSTVRGITDGISAMVTGRTAGGADIYRNQTQQNEAGIGGAFQRYLRNPTRFGD